MYHNDSLEVEFVHHFSFATHRKLLILGKALIRAEGSQIQEKCGVLAHSLGRVKCFFREPSPDSSLVTFWVDSYFLQQHRGKFPSYDATLQN